MNSKDLETNYKKYIDGKNVPEFESSKFFHNFKSFFKELFHKGKDTNYYCFDKTLTKEYIRKQFNK